ncbi:3-dehydroquinate synthase [Sphingosinicella rhizophila]|uniref:3-dehydroquinate synthase n=1 Tax=Sphingosinicella rhizophila TaxID=3050082 RepID=A0ABU3Q960_9SPHN|nr:3-dehydroquinate synthase [Sphingosinicella sp. GR2756]MDT9599946.1 3-dehydroquinate synthase [Sphingosinicella sp. GR2756]
MSEGPRKELVVALGDHSYPILVADGLIDDMGAELAGISAAERLIVVSDEIVWSLHGARLSASIAKAGRSVAPVILPPGEGTKSWPVLADLVDRLLSLGIDRDDHLIAFGGGVIGDLVGFAAAIVMRGCAYVQIPTTLLAQVDSSVGGKTAINTAAGKNLVGAFHQPSAVLIDPSLLDTLPLRHLRAGYAEVVKYGLISDPDFFAWCESHGAALIGGDRDAQVHAISTSVASKAAIVGEDERERKGRRALLNLGHTFGHALEAECGFSDILLHGEAVAAGSLLAFLFSVRRGLCPAADADRVRDHFSAVGMDPSVAAPALRGGGKALIAHMQLDKKKSGGTLPFILAHGIGQAFIDRNVDIADVELFLDEQARGIRRD